MRPIVAIRISVVTALAVCIALTIGGWSRRTPPRAAAQLRVATVLPTAPEPEPEPESEPEPQTPQPRDPTVPDDGAPAALADDCTGPLAVSPDRVFWVTPHSIKSMSPDGTHARVIVDGEFILLTVDRGQIFFVAAGSGAIERANVDGSRRSVLVQNPRLGAMAVDGAWVYWTSDENSIWRVARNGGAPQKLGTDSAEIAEIAVARGRIYMGTDAGVHSLPITGGRPREDVAVAFPMGIAAANGRVAWSSGINRTIEEIAGGRNKVVIDGEAGHTDRVAYHRASGAILFVVASDYRTEIRAVSGGASRLLVQVEGQLRELAANDRHAFWTETFDGDEFRNAPNRGGCAIRRVTLPRWK